MRRRNLRARVEDLEEKRAQWEREHLPLSDVWGLYRAVLEIVGEEAGPDVGGRCAARLIEGKAARVHGLLSGLTPAQLEDVGARAGLPLPDLRGKGAPELVRLAFQGARA